MLSAPHNLPKLMLDGCGNATFPTCMMKKKGVYLCHLPPALEYELKFMAEEWFAFGDMGTDV